MKIGIDARPLQHETQYRGIGKSLEFLLLALKGELGADDSLVFYVDAGLPKPAALQNFPEARVIRVPTSRLGRKRYLRSVLPSFRAINPKPKDIDVLLQNDASFGVPKSVPTVVAFLDLIPYLFRSQEKQRPVKGLRKGKDMLARNLYWEKYLRVLGYYQKATAISAISKSSKKDLLEFFPNIPASRVTVIHLGTNALEHEGSPGKTIQKLAAKPYLLYVGGIDTRKNIVGLLEAFYELKPAHPDLRLITVGKEFELTDRLDDLGWSDILKHQPAYAKDVISPGFLSSADLHYLYEKAAAFVFPSRYEGFGLPVLEAMQAGCPVVTYDNSSIPEVAGAAALLVKDGEPLAPVIDRLLKDPKLRGDLIAKGRLQAARFSWNDTAKKTLDLLRKVSK